MDLASLWPATTQLAAAALGLAVGALVLATDMANPLTRWLGLFLAARGATAGAAGLTTVLTGDALSIALALSSQFHLLSVLAIIFFVAHYDPRGGILTRSSGARWTTLLLALSIAILVARDPCLSVCGAPPALHIGPLGYVSAPLVLGLAAVILPLGRERSERGIMNDLVALTLMGNTMFDGLRAVAAISFGGPSIFAPGLGGVMAGTVVPVATLALGVVAAVRLHRAAVPGRGGVLGLALVSGGLTAAFFGGSNAGTPLLIIGLWRASIPVVLGYSLLRYRFAGNAARIRRTAGWTALGVLALVAFVLGGDLGARLVSGPLGFVGGGIAASVAFGALPHARRLGARVGARLAPASAQSSASDVFAVAVEAALADGHLTRAKERALAKLATKLQLDPHRALELRESIETSLREGSETAAASVPRTPQAPQTDPFAAFETVRELGQGASGTVTLVRDATLGREVVLKRPRVDGTHPGQRAVLLQEARIAARIQHPHVVTIHQVIDAMPPGIVMEYVDGGDLAGVLRASSEVSEARVRAIARDVLSGLAAIHAVGIVHRDLKPANVLLTRSGIAKIADFGIAADVTELAGATMGETRPGTLLYMSPEQVRGELIDARSDLYALGAVLHEMLAREHYFAWRERDPTGVRSAILTEPPRAMPAHVSPDLRAFVASLLEKDPSRRPPTAAAALATLGAGPPEVGSPA